MTCARRNGGFLWCWWFAFIFFIFIFYGDGYFVFSDPSFARVCVRKKKSLVAAYGSSQIQGCGILLEGERDWLGLSSEGNFRFWIFCALEKPELTFLL